ncbi:hypothetical protein NPIL_603381, partial [Nephila pilipes]
KIASFESALVEIDHLDFAVELFFSNRKR